MEKNKIKKRKVSSIKVITNQKYLDTLLKILTEAKNSIDILSFSFAIGSASGKHNLKSAPYKIALKLKEIKEKKGDDIRIRFFTEGLRETMGRNKVTAEFLEEAGIEVKFGSTHAKGFCIDQKVVLFGSTNLTHQSITKNLEANLLIRDKKLARGFMDYFEHLWNDGHHSEAQVSPPYLPDGLFKDEIVDMIRSARKKIEFSIYFFNHREIENALIEAHENGVHVKGFIHQHASFALPYIWANRSTVRRMKKAGISDIHWGPLHLFSHAKYIIVDGKEVALGTGNWLVEDVQIHPQLYIYVKDSKVAKDLSRHLNEEVSMEKVA